jgi:formate-dependent phosphoribosylglycinamide formyltransferase (GAR transformylase)
MIIAMTLCLIHTIASQVCNESAVKIAKTILAIIGGIGFGVALILVSSIR